MAVSNDSLVRFISEIPGTEASPLLIRGIRFFLARSLKVVFVGMEVTWSQ